MVHESLPEDFEVREYKGKSLANSRFTDGRYMNRVFTQPTRFVKGISHQDQDLDVATVCSDGGNSHRSSTSQPASHMNKVLKPIPTLAKPSFDDQQPQGSSNGQAVL